VQNDRHRHEEPERLGIELIAPELSNDSPAGDIVETECFGGLLRRYRRVA